MSDLVFKVGMRHTDFVRAAVKTSQLELEQWFRNWNINYPIVADGIYGVATRGAWATFLRAWGAESAQALMENGITPWLRTKVRNNNRTANEKAIFESPERKEYRAALRKKFKGAGSEVASYPMREAALVTDAWDYHGTAHDGVDLVCPWKEPILAVFDAKVVDVRSGDHGDRWWGKGAKPTAGHPISDGDGIIIIQALRDVGPHVKKGFCFGYGHSERHVVREGATVRAGQKLGYAGWANGPHVHAMLNGGTYMPTQGLGDRDPKPFLNWAKELS